jgi:hypothetical protein
MVKVQILASNLTEVEVGQVTLYFSYESLVAFQHPAVGGRVVSENQWSKTTGKHLTLIDGRTTKAEQKQRLAASEFNALVKQYIDTIGEEPKGEHDLLGLGLNTQGG